jgi:hypothetical protein
VFVDPVGEGFGEECVLSACPVELAGGVDQRGGSEGVSVGPVGPVVEGVESVPSVDEPLVVVADAPDERTTDLEVIAEALEFDA